MAWILIVFLILLGGLIAPFGDILGTKIGKARFSILKLRPKKTATIITIITGGFISSISIGLLILVSEEFRQRLFVDIPFLQKTLDESKKALIPLQEERKELEVKIIQKEKELNQLKNNIKEFRRGNIVIKRGQTLFIAEINSSSNVKIDLTKIYNEADKFVTRIVTPVNKEAKNILLWRPNDITKIQKIAASGGNWILLIGKTILLTNLSASLLIFAKSISKLELGLISAINKVCPLLITIFPLLNILILFFN